MNVNNSQLNKQLIPSKMKMNKHKIIFILTFVSFVFLSFIAYEINQKLLLNEIKNYDNLINSQLEVGKSNIQNYLKNFSEDLIFLKTNDFVQTYVNSNFESKKIKKIVEELFFHFAKSYNTYYQLRIIDKNGNELVRVDNKYDKSTLVIPNNQLQNKSSRYYFKEAFKLNQNQIYVSPIDLNVENNQIEIPYVPVIRIATPLFDSENNKKGIIIINKYFKNLLELIPKTSFIQTTENNIISLDKNNQIKFVKTSYVFNEPEGKIILQNENNTTINYRKDFYFETYPLVFAIKHSAALNKKTNLLYTVTTIFLIFLLFVLIRFFNALLYKKTKF